MKEPIYIWPRAIMPMIRVGVLLAVGACATESSRHDPDPIAPPVPRKLATRPLFDSMPIHNSVVDPTFDQLGQGGWFAFSPNSQRSVTLFRYISAVGPVRLPALFAKKSEMPSGAVVLGSLGPTPGAIEVSVWAGRKADASDTSLGRLSASLTGLFTDGTTWALDLKVDPASRFASSDGIVWYRLVVNAPVGPLGFPYLVITDAGSDDYYLSMPVSVSTSANMALHAAVSPTSPVVRRRLSDNETAALAQAQAERSRRLAVASPARPMALR